MITADDLLASRQKTVLEKMLQTLCFEEEQTLSSQAQHHVKEDFSMHTQ